jgi:hypothetical protein
MVEVRVLWVNREMLQQFVSERRWRLGVRILLELHNGGLGDEPVVVPV